jgi:hypothetical protein
MLFTPPRSSGRGETPFSRPDVAPIPLAHRLRSSGPKDGLPTVAFV